MTKKEVCEECENGESVFKCVSCCKYLCDNCANNNHFCLNQKIDELKDRLYIDIDELDILEED